MVICSLAASTAWAGWEEGEAALERRQYPAALAHFMPLAEQGDARAQAAVAHLYRFGLGVPQDAKEALAWLRKAQAQGHAHAIFQLARMTGTGEGGPADAADAMVLYRRAAELGHAQAQAHLGAAYLDGRGLPEDAAAGVKWLRQAAEGGSDIGRFRLAWAYLEGQVVTADATRAAELFKQSAEQGLPRGMREFGRRLERGEGVPADLTEAKSWYEQAAGLEDRLAMYYLGALHDEGRGVPSDKAHAVYWYLRSARLGEAHAYNDLGAMYANGEFVARDPVIACGLFIRAAAAGQDNGRKNLERTRADLSPSDRSRAEALAEQLATPLGMDEALDRSLQAAQGRPDKAPDFAAVCLPQPPEASPAQYEAWARDAHDRGFLWRATKGGRTSYLYGTLHVVKLPWAAPGPRLMAALDAVDVVAVEADVDQIEALRNASQSAATAPLPPALQARLDGVLGPACVDALRKAGASAFGQSTLISLRDAAALDLHFAVAPDFLLPALARLRKLQVQALEDPAEVLDRIASLRGEDAEIWLKAQLDRKPQDRRRLLMQLAAVWERGDIERLQSFETWCECADTPQDKRLLQRMGHDRNEGMAQAIDDLHGMGRRVLAAVGALHMAGEQGLPKLLARRGYAVERLDPQALVGTTPAEMRVVGTPALAR